MRHRLRTFEARILPRGWLDLLRQIGLFVGAFVLYDLVRGLFSNPGTYKPFGDAMKIIDFERTLHIFIEPSINAWAAHARWLMDAADWTYLNGHFFVTLAALAYLYVRRNGSFYFVRNTVMVAMAIALVAYAVYPTAPPRLLPEWGFTDTVSQFLYGSTGHLDNGPASAFTNMYAAVPSMHVCFAVLIGFSMAKLVSWRPGKIAWSLYPLFVTFVVVATANHYLTDVFLGALTAGAAVLLSKRLLARAKPEKWSFGQAQATA
jgi:PAP2 superfamily